ncbi:MAG: ArdC-like ssDNA-binding domain-containing protein [Gammaproteobacteria bacterium]
MHTWITFKQAKGLRGYMKKAGKATPVVYVSTYTKRSADVSGEETEEAIPFLKWYFVFNIERCEGLPERIYRRPAPTIDETSATAAARPDPSRHSANFCPAICTLTGPFFRLRDGSTG